MISRKTIYIFLASAVVCSIVGGLIVFLSVLGITLITLFILNRGIFYTIKANKLLADKQYEKGYEVLHRAYLTNTVPYIVVGGYIFLSIKYNHLDNAKEAINRILDADFHFTIKDRYKKEVKS